MSAEAALDHGGPVGLPLTPWRREELDAPVFERFKRMVERQPQHLAVVSGRRRWAYAEVQALALALAAELQATAAEPVAILLPAGGRFAAACLGALAAGRPYVPIDPAFPAERNRLILQQAGVSQIISDASYTMELAHIGADIPMIDIDRLQAASPILLNGASASPAYILYTSGSTGQPKGVYQNQRGLLHDIYQYSLAVHLHHDDKLTWLYSPSVNGALRDLYAALLNGATLYALPVKELGLQGLAACMAEARITVFHAIPPLLRAFLQSNPPLAALASVRLAYISGDRLFSADVDVFYRFFPRTALIYNGIGSTECATLYRHWFIGVGTVLDGGLAPVGYAIADRRSRLLDEHGQPVAVGGIGEVEVSSAFIAQGYWRNPELSRACFVEMVDQPGQRRFMVGDLARERADGLWEYIGRKDGQVKIRGYRVETGMVEAALRRLPMISDAAVVVSGDQSPELTAYLAGRACDLEHVRRQLAQSLPPAAVPTRFYWLDAIPRLANFKTDMLTLKQMTAAAPICPVDQRVDGESRLNAATLQLWWNEVLQRQGDIDADRSFEDYGGDSLKALSLLVLMEQGLQRTVPIQIVHGQMTINSLLRALSSTTRISHHLYIVAGRAGISGAVLRLIRQLPGGAQVHLPPLPAVEDEFEQSITIADLGRHMADHIVSTAPVQPLHLLGISFGARVVFEAACELQRRGVPVHSLTVVDMGPAYGQPDQLKVWRARLRRGYADMQAGRLAAMIRRGSHAARTGLLKALLHRMPRVTLKLFYQRYVPTDKPDAYRQQVRAELAARQAACWRPSFYQGRMTVVLATNGIAKDRRLPDDLGWQPYARHVHVLRIAGGHSDFYDSAELLHYFQHLLAD